MAKHIKQKSVKGYDEQKELDAVDKIFKELADDKSLPTFGEHFMHCLIADIGRNVDLKILYPKHYNKLSAWLAGHNRRILESRKV